MALEKQEFTSFVLSHLLLPLLLSPDVGVDALPDGELAGSLADLRQVGAGEALGHLGQEGQVNLEIERFIHCSV